MIVEASILARLFRVRLLTLDARVAIMPADLVVAPSDPRSQLPPSRRQTPRPASSSPSRRLAEAVRSINAGAELLQQAERNAPTMARAPR